jgi:hypothetical protein
VPERASGDHQHSTFPAGQPHCPPATPTRGEPGRRAGGGRGRRAGNAGRPRNETTRGAWPSSPGTPMCRPHTTNDLLHQLAGIVAISDQQSAISFRLIDASKVANILEKSTAVDFSSECKYVDVSPTHEAQVRHLSKVKDEKGNLDPSRSETPHYRRRVVFLRAARPPILRQVT